MVIGLDVFKEHFKGFEDHYVIIGGTACDIQLQGMDMSPRATGDIDMILVIEKMSPEFGRKFWEFINIGEYQNAERKREDGKDSVPEMYRFSNPKGGFPIRIELLSKFPDILGVPTGFHLVPIPIGENMPSLSSIVMDGEYYEITVKNSILRDGVRMADPLSLLCLKVKVKAYLNLTKDKKSGKEVRSSDIKKHIDDVFKIFAMLITSDIATDFLSVDIKNNLQTFILDIEKTLPNQSLQDSLKRTNEHILGYIDLMRTIFELE